MLVTIKTKRITFLKIFRTHITDSNHFFVVLSLGKYPSQITSYSRQLSLPEGMPCDTVWPEHHIHMDRMTYQRCACDPTTDNLVTRYAGIIFPIK